MVQKRMSCPLCNGRPIGLIPTYQSIGLAAAFLLFGLRMIQGLCLGGEYGGAITYVAEHVPDDKRGYYTGWLQTLAKPKANGDKTSHTPNNRLPASCQC
jgi:hypothetical protein